MKILILVTLISITTLKVFPSDKKPVRILTWWGYLTNDNLKLATKKCGVAVSLDQYYSNNEFLRRFKQDTQKYEILIFSNTVYELIAPFLNSTILKIDQGVSSYHPVIKKIYNKRKYKANTTFFLHALTGFLWNPSQIHLSSQDDIKNIFKKAKNNLVVLIDDPIEFNYLLSSSNVNMQNKGKVVTRNLFQNSKVLISNEYETVSKDPAFAFAYGWSGGAIANKGKHNFLIHDQLSYISSDLVSLKSSRNEAHCIAKELNSEQLLAKIQKKSHYFSSYITLNSVKNGTVHHLYKPLLNKLPRMKWLPSPSSKDFTKLNKRWKAIKYEVKNDSK